ncbi:MAG: hypothetical protein WGN25_12400 [Candidatus Electrothrix sp. GW3-4]|uniref:hypothetical protein n=1 Tax=Candidatus Electrothrix sp. GW3-4 TaxID=3126740 RepID=UPI0030CCA390
MRKIIMILALGLAAGSFVMTDSASAVQMETDTAAITVDKLIAEMQQEMIIQNYSARLLKNQMRAKMMAVRVPQNFMKDSIQPAMIEKIRVQMKSQLVETMTLR